MNNHKAGIASIGIHFPSLYLSVEELAKLRNVDPMKYLQGLGCSKIAICPKNYGAMDLAVEAARRALSRWEGDKHQIGLIAVGTESSLDMSRPLSAWVADELDIKGPIRSYEVKHACYGGTLAIRQALEWKLSGASHGKAALIIASDVALYKPGDPGEATEGAGAVAIIIDDPLIAEINPLSYPWSKPAFDFWRPVGHKYPLVEGQFSLLCYQEAAIACFHAFLNNQDEEKVMQDLHAICFHTPFPRMVKKAFYSVGQSLGWSDEKIEEFFNEKVNPTMDWNRLSGNSYTASLWLAVAKTLAGLELNKRIAAFSYGSGCGAELLTLNAGPLAKQGAWVQDVEKDIAHRKEISATRYEELTKD